MQDVSFHTSAVSLPVKLVLGPTRLRAEYLRRVLSWLNRYDIVASEKMFAGTDVPDQKTERISEQQPGSPLITVDHVSVLANALIPPLFDDIDPAKKSLARPPPGTPEAVDKAFDSLIARLLPVLQSHLDTLVGRTDLDHQQSAELAKALTKLARRLNAAFECPHCLQPARAIRYGRLGAGDRDGWRYEHTESLRHAGSTVLGPLKLMPRLAST